MSDSLISVQNFSKSFSGFKAVDDLSFEVNPGEIFAFLGSNGSGKTTTIRCLLDIYQPDHGTLLIDGQKYTDNMNDKIGYLPEERGLYVRSTVNDLFLYFLQLRGIEFTRAKELMEEYLKRVELFDHRDKNVSQLSSGMQQKVQIGAAIIHKPKLLILDEPFKGLDPVNRQVFTEIFKELKKEGITIMYSTHAIDEAQKLADRLVIIHKGKRKAYGSIDEVRKSFGKDTIHLEFTGNIPDNPKLYKSTVTNKTAEIIPNEGVDPQIVLKELVKSGLKILSFKIDYPSLNEVFINIVRGTSS